MQDFNAHPHGKTTARAPIVPRQSVTFTRLQATDQTDFAIARKLLLRHFHVSANQIVQGESLLRRHADIGPVQAPLWRCLACRDEVQCVSRELLLFLD